jgi:hypothetical protein
VGLRFRSQLQICSLTANTVFDTKNEQFSAPVPLLADVTDTVISRDGTWCLVDYEGRVSPCNIPCLY